MRAHACIDTRSYARAKLAVDQVDADDHFRKSRQRIGDVLLKARQPRGEARDVPEKIMQTTKALCIRRIDNFINSAAFIVPSTFPVRLAARSRIETLQLPNQDIYDSGTIHRPLIDQPCTWSVTYKSGDTLASTSADDVAVRCAAFRVLNTREQPVSPLFIPS